MTSRASRDRQRTAPSRLKRMFEGRARYLTWTVIFTVWGGAILGIALAMLPAGSTGKGALPQAPGRARVPNCGCALPEGGRLDLEVERTAANTWLWFLTDGARRVPLVESRPDSLQGPVLPSNLGHNLSLDLYLGCTGTAVVVAAFEQAGAFAFPGGQHRWTRKLSRRVESGRGAARDGEVRCYPLQVDLGKGTVAVPVRGGWKPALDLRTGLLR